MNIPASVQAAGATVVTRSVGAVTRCFAQKDKPAAVLIPFLRHEGILLTITGVFTLFIQEVFNRVILPEFRPESFLAKNQTLWRAIISVPGLFMLEWLNNKYQKKLALKQRRLQRDAQKNGKEYDAYLQFVKKCSTHLESAPPPKPIPGAPLRASNATSLPKQLYA